MKSPFAKPLDVEYPLSISLTDSMWVAVVRGYFDPPGPDGQCSVGEMDSGLSIKVVGEGEETNVCAFCTGQWEAPAPVSETMYEVTLVAEFPFLVVCNSGGNWEWSRFDFAVAQRIKGGELGYRPKLPKRPRFVRGAKGWGWVKLTELLALVDADPTKAGVPYWHLISAKMEREPTPPPESTEWSEERLADWSLWEDPIRFRGIVITLDNPRSKPLEVGHGSHADFMDLYGDCPKDADLTKLDVNRIWVPAGLAIDVLYLDYFLRLRCGQAATT